MEKIKVIQISHSSESYALGEGEKELKKLVLNDWPTQVARHIKKYYPKIEVECWAPEKLYEEEERYKDSGILYRFFPTTFSVRYALDLSLPMFRELKKEIKKSMKKDYKLVMHIHEIHNLHGLIFASFLKYDKIMVQHHGGNWPLKHLKESKKKKWFFLLFVLAQLWENLVLKNIKNYYALSKQEINYLEKKAPKSNIKLQTMGISDDYYHNLDKKVARKKLNIPKNEKFVLYIGRIAKIKGMSYLLEAMKSLRDVKVRCIGFGPEEPIFKKFVKQNRLDNVEFLGGVFGKKKMLYLSAADALVLPSLKEGAPVTIMESLARNRPIIASNAGGIPLMIKNGREGIVIRQKNPEDIVNAVKEILKWKKKNVKKYAERYRWKKIIDDTVRDYEEI